MRYSKMYIPTVKDVVPESEALNYRLLYKAGYVRKSAAGVFVLLPMGRKAMNRLGEVVTAQLELEGFFEISLPQKQEQESLFKMLSAAKLSYKELPVGLWHHKECFAEGIRPRLGLLQPKAWEAIVGYGLFEEAEAHEAGQDKARVLCRRVLQEFDLDFVEGWSLSEDCSSERDHVFFLPYSGGGEQMLHCSRCGTYISAASMECSAMEKKEEEAPDAEIIYTPQVKSITDLADYLKITARDIIKTLIYKADDQLYGVLLRGDRELSEAKLRKALGCHRLRAATEAEVFEATQAQVGFAGPIGLQAEMICDWEAAAMPIAVVGANRTDYHYINAAPGRDFTAVRRADLRKATAEESCPECGSNIISVEGFELAAIKSFGSIAAQNNKILVTGKEGRPINPYMFCIEMNTTRMLAAAAEKNHDKDGLALPSSLAPYDVVVMAVHPDNELQRQKAEEIYNQLQNMKLRVLLDDRSDRISIKFKDSELLGIPLRITVGKRIAEDIVEVKYRRGELQELSIKALISNLKGNGEEEC